jgi:hypothetical protein
MDVSLAIVDAGAVHARQIPIPAPPLKSLVITGKIA